MFPSQIFKNKNHNFIKKLFSNKTNQIIFLQSKSRKIIIFLMKFVMSFLTQLIKITKRLVNF